MLRHFIENAVRLGTIVVVLCGGFTACSSQEELSPQRRRAVTTRAADLTPSQATRIARLRDRVRWVGEAHHAAMVVIHEDVSARRLVRKEVPRKGSADYCRLLERAGRAGISVLDRGRRLSRPVASQNADIQSVPDIEKCARRMSIFSNHASLPLQQITEEGSEPIVTGAYESYLDLMQAQVDASGGSVAGVSAAVNNVLATAMAEGAAEGDLLALASFADVAESSAVEWNSYNWGSAGVDTCGSTGRCLMSLFGRKKAGNKIMTVISADVAGCLAHVRSWGMLKTIVAAPAWQALAGRCGLRAAIASGAVILTLI